MIYLIIGLIVGGAIALVAGFLREKKLKRRREQQEYIQQLILQKQTNALAENWAGIFTPPSASSTMTQKILPNGAVFLATKTSGVKRENPQPVFETD